MQLQLGQLRLLSLEYIILFLLKELGRLLVVHFFCYSRSTHLFSNPSETNLDSYIVSVIVEVPLACVSNTVNTCWMSVGKPGNTCVVMFVGNIFVHFEMERVSPLFQSWLLFLLVLLRLHLCLLLQNLLFLSLYLLGLQLLCM